MRVNEIFGPTFQGEGPAAGRNATFLRLAGCNLDCAWCDTPYTWDWTGKNGYAYDREAETHVVTDGLLEDLERCGLAANKLLVVTGGEPLLQPSPVTALVQEVEAAFGAETHIETNGTRPPLVHAHPSYVVSPKLANSGIARWTRIRVEALHAFVTAGAAFKFVACSSADLDEIADLAVMCGLPWQSIWVMPEGTNTDVTLGHARALADEVAARGWHLSLRTHVLLWGNERCR